VFTIYPLAGQTPRNKICYINLLQQSMRFLVFTIYPLAGQTPRNKICYINLHHVPSITHLKIFILLGGTWMHCVNCLMCLNHQFSHQIIYIRYTKHILYLNASSSPMTKLAALPCSTSFRILKSEPSFFGAAFILSNKFDLTYK